MVKKDTNSMNVYGISNHKNKLVNNKVYRLKNMKWTLTITIKR